MCARDDTATECGRARARLRTLEASDRVMTSPDSSDGTNANKSFDLRLISRRYPQTVRAFGTLPDREAWLRRIHELGVRWDEARERWPIPKLFTVLAGSAEAILPIFGTDAADVVESVGDGASEPDGGAEVLPLRWWIVP